MQADSRGKHFDYADLFAFSIRGSSELFSKWIERFFVWLRDGVAKGLVRLHFTPTSLTLLGAALTIAAAVPLAYGPRWWPLAAAMMVLSGACDMLDGAVARLGGRQTRFGGVLDSTADRACDVALYAGAAIYFLKQAGGQSITYPLLCFISLANGYLISYIAARGGEEGVPTRVGFWQRGERFVTLIIGLATGHLTTALWLLATWPFLTVLQRMLILYRALAVPGEGRSAERPGLFSKIAGLLFWQYPRGSLAYDIHAGLIIIILIVVPEPLVSLFKGLVYG